MLHRVVRMHEVDGANRARAKIKNLELKNFEGVRSAKELENLIWYMEQYFKATKILEV